MLIKSKRNNSEKYDKVVAYLCQKLAVHYLDRLAVVSCPYRVVNSDIIKIT